MRLRSVLAVVILTIILAVALLAQDAPRMASQPEAKSATVPITLDHNRVVIDVDVILADGSTMRVKAWVDNGNPDLVLSQHLARTMGLSVLCAGHACGASTPVSAEILIGSMKVSLSNLRAEVRQNSKNAEKVAFPGMNAEMNIPSSVLRNYDVLINFPNKEFTIAQPGTLKFKGVKTKVVVAEDGLVQVPSQIENKKYNLGLDLGSPMSSLAGDLFDKLAVAHPDWPRMTGAVGPANVSGTRDEAACKLMRVDRVQYGPLFLTKVAVEECSKDRGNEIEKRAGVATAGILGTDALINYRVGIDYSNSTVYFDIGRLFNFPAFDVIGVMLHPEDDGRFTIAGTADFDGKPSVPQGPEGVQVGDHLVAVDGIPVLGSTLGQVWSMLGGEAGKQRSLTIERAGKQFTVVATVRHFLGDAAANFLPAQKH